MSDPLAQCRRIVIKIGSSLLVDRERRSLRDDWLVSVADDIARLRAERRDIIVVSSGAIALGRGALGLDAGVLKLEESQAAAAAGQVRLAQAWADSLARHGITGAQILLTPDDTEQRRRYLNARATLRTLLAFGAVPVVNENDTVATSEIRFGDNDRLAARVASMMDADCLVLLSDVDGLYTADPSRDASARHIPDVTAITPDIEAMAGDSISGLGRGGMRSKLAAAAIATRAGATVLIARGSDAHPITALRSGARATRFQGAANAAQAKKRWIAGSLTAQGAIIIDDGAVTALEQGRSLLPAGVTRIDGTFERGDAIAIRNRSGRDIARGLVAYHAEDARRIAGRKSDEIETLLGYRGRDELVHRDDLALLTESSTIE
jgi:glutamate 5-kinase